eukprot:m.1340923 g.1340923  ORF g.1340923 m.1340923 type:complete len:55 (-) comp24891_c0_seq17:2726-2890(-)
MIFGNNSILHTRHMRYQDTTCLLCTCVLLCGIEGELLRWRYLDCEQIDKQCRTT